MHGFLLYIPQSHLESARVTCFEDDRLPIPGGLIFSLSSAISSLPPKPKCTMSSLFCCAGVKPYKPSYLQHQSKFNEFMTWAGFPKESCQSKDEIDLDEMNPEFVVQLVRQANYGPLEATRYFAKTRDHAETFVEVGERALIQANFKKLNS